MRRTILLLVLVLLMMLAAVPAASAHVHGITPLNNLDCRVDNTVTGGRGTDGTPADDGEGGPIIGLIPRDTGKAPIGGGDGGRNAPVAACPA